MAAEMTLGQLLSAQKPGQFVGLEKVKPSGSLAARRALNGSVNFFWRYTIGQKPERVAIGNYDPSAPPRSVMPGPKGHSIAAAVRAAQDLAIKHQHIKESGGFRAILKAETLLVSPKVSKDIRGRLQSHGISGVQARHYDAHEYIDKKREALRALYVSLTRKAPAKAVAHKATANKRTRRRAVSP